MVERYPKFRESIRVKTWPYEFRGFIGNRNFVLETERGERLAYANSLWSFVNTKTGMPQKLTEADISGYVLEEKLDMAYAPRKIKLPADMQAGEIIEVRPHHVDTNHHVNNGQYVRMAMDYLPEGFQVGQLRTEYKKQARLGDLIFPSVSIEEEICVVSLNDETGTAYCITEFQKMKEENV